MKEICDVIGDDESELTGLIIGAAIRVHEALGPGFLESIYEEALCIELREMGLSSSGSFWFQSPIAIGPQGHLGWI